MPFTNKHMNEHHPLLLILQSFEFPNFEGATGCMTVYIQVISNTRILCSYKGILLSPLAANKFEVYCFIPVVEFLRRETIGFVYCISVNSTVFYDSSLCGFRLNEFSRTYTYYKANTSLLT